MLTFSLLSFTACQENSQETTRTIENEIPEPNYRITYNYAFAMSDHYDLNGSDSSGRLFEGNISDKTFFLNTTMERYRVERSVIYDFSSALLELTESRFTDNTDVSSQSPFLTRRCYLENFPLLYPMSVSSWYNPGWIAFNCNDSSSMKWSFYVTEKIDNAQYLVETFAFFDNTNNQEYEEIWTYELSADASISIKKRMLSLTLEDIKANNTISLSAISGTSVFDK